MSFLIVYTIFTTLNLMNGKGFFMRKYYFILLIVSILFLSACGKQSVQEEAGTYEQNMADIYNRIAASTSALDAIDPNSETAVTEMFDKLEEINTAFQEMDALEVPEEFSSIEAMADNAAFYMNEALTLYHEAYAGENYDPDAGNNAKAQYVAAMTYLSYIGQILMGEIPEGATVTTSN